MPINLIASVVNYKSKLAIGKHNNLLYRLKEDLAFFKNITTNCLGEDSLINRNVVLMGRKTWFSIPNAHRPLKNRLNLVLTNDKRLRKQSPYPWHYKIATSIDLKKDVYFVSFNEFVDFYKRTNANVFVIGGSEIYNKFLNNAFLKPESVYLTEVSNAKFEVGEEPDTYMDHLTDDYKLVGVSNKKQDSQHNISYRFLTYKLYRDYKSEEHKYLNLMKHIIENGNYREDRTGVGTISTFGNQLHFDISQTIPVMTTKRVPWKHCIHELLWFCRGDTDVKLLQKHGVKIWDGNSSRKFLDSRGLYHFEEGVLGEVYGWQWRFFGADYSQAFADTSKIDTSKIGGFDQLQYIVNELKNNPFSRRIMVSAWNPARMHQMALPPCHYSFMFYVEEDSQNQKHLSCHFVMRSNDVFLATAMNILSYSVLTYILALKCDMKPKSIVYSCSDTHIYKNHLEQVKQLLERKPRPFPKLVINPDVKHKDFKDISVEDFELVGYFPDTVIKAPMAI